MFLSETTIDDLMRVVYSAIQEHGIDVVSSKGKHRELTGVLLELTNPRARLSLTETRGKPFSCLGELCWYLSGSEDVESISFYIPIYKKFGEDEGHVHGAYGPRIFGGNEESQFQRVKSLLRRRDSTRQAVIQIFDSSDLHGSYKDVPCTCTLQFFIRNNQLHLVTQMRSNDAYLGLPHDLFCFTMLQELMACSLNFEVGTYKHSVGSLHIYEKHKECVDTFLNEGWQTIEPMPAMPTDNLWDNVDRLLNIEEQVRGGMKLTSDDFAVLSPYWRDLAYLIQLFAYGKSKNIAKMKEVREVIGSRFYEPYVNNKIQICESE